MVTQAFFIWFSLFAICMLFAYVSKLLAMSMAKKTLQSQKWPSGIWVVPIGYITKSAHGDEAAKVSRSYVIMMDICMWMIFWIFIIIGLFWV